MDSSLEGLGQATKCLLCNETPEELKILHCFHVFCANCLAANVDVSRSQGTTFDCPRCKAKTNLPIQNDFGSLETSRLHSHISKILSLSSAAEATSGPKCSCKKRNPSTVYCSNCARYLCNECFEGHELFTEGHRVIDLKELENQDYRLLFRQETFCSNPRHAKEILKFYCNTCKMSVCQQCLLQDHNVRSHDISDLEETANAQTTALKEKLEQLETKEAVEEANLARLRELVIKTKSDAEKAKVEVMKAAEELVAFIEENKRRLIDEIDEGVLEVLAKTSEQEHVLQQLGSGKEYASILTEYTTSCLVLDCKDMVHERLDELNALHVSLSDADYNIRYYPSNEVYKLQELGLGSVVKTRPADATKSDVVMETSLDNLAALHLVSLRVSIKNSYGEQSDCPYNKIDIDVEPKEDLQDFQVSENIEGKCSVEFKPKVPGKFTITAKINGQHVCHSPMSLDVKPQELKVVGEFVPSGMPEPFKDACGIAVNKSNTKIAITDLGSNVIALFNPDGTFLNKINITGKGRKLSYPLNVAFLDDDSIAVVDNGNKRIVIFDTTTERILKCFGREGEGMGEFNNPYGIHVDSQGCIIVSDTKRVQIFSQYGVYKYQLSNNIFKDDFCPAGIVSLNNLLIVSDFKNNVIYVVDMQSSPKTVKHTIGGPGSSDGKLYCPCGLAVDNDGYLLVCDRGNNRIQKFTMDGHFVGQTCDPIIQAYNLAVLADGRILVTNFLTEKKVHLVMSD